MRYDWKEGVAPEEFSKEFFEEIDRRFFGAARSFLPPERIPFDSLVHFDELRDRDVLEVGVGNGSHAQLLAGHAKSFTGIDITPYAVKSTQERMRVFGLDARILQMDVEKLAFEDNSFDFVWSWGVIHHSSNTQRALGEIGRVLRPGGRAVIMVYYRGWWNFYTLGLLYFGLIQGKLFKHKSLHKVVQSTTDGAIARYYSCRQWRAAVSDWFDVETMQVVGDAESTLPLPPGRFKAGVCRRIPGSVTRFLAGACRMGGMLAATMRGK